MTKILVLGGGPAGYVAAGRAAQLGAEVTLVEAREIGGTCLNRGCVPTKAMVAGAERLHEARRGADYGVVTGAVSLDFDAFMARKDAVTSRLRDGVAHLLRTRKVQVVTGRGTLAGRGRIRLEPGATLPDGAVLEQGAELEGDAVILATGSEPVRMGLFDWEDPRILTSDELLRIDHVPASLAIVGGGVIGLEMAAYYAVAGSRVTVVEMLDHIAGTTDREISSMLQKEYRKKGVEFKLSTKVVAVEPGKVVCEAEGKTLEVPADKVLLSIGRRAATEDIGLENIGVAMERGVILTDDKCRTNVENVYAAGDCIGKVMLAHTAYREAEVAVNAMLGKRDRMRYNANPSVIYTHPEVACVGMTEEEARAAGVDFEVKKLSMRFSGRFIAENEGADGLCKVLIHKKHRNVLGVHMIGNGSSEAVWGAALMIEQELRVKDAKEIIFPHPTVSEIIRETIWEFDD